MKEDSEKKDKRGLRPRMAAPSAKGRGFASFPESNKVSRELTADLQGLQRNGIFLSWSLTLKVDGGPRRMDKEFLTDAEEKRLRAFAELALAVGKRRRRLLDKIRDALVRGDDSVALSLMREYAGIKGVAGK